jgi:hypothetical protein
VLYPEGARGGSSAPCSCSVAGTRIQQAKLEIRTTPVRRDKSINHISPEPLGTLDLNFFVCRRISFFVFVIVNCRANGENSISFSLRSPWKSCSASPFMVFKTNAIAFFRCELNKPLTEVAKPSPAPSLGFLRNAGS